MQAVSSSQHASPGTAAYLPGLIARAQASHPDLPIEPVILQSLLLCLIAQPRLPLGSAKPDCTTGSGVHLILRTKEEDIGLVVNLVASTLQHILGVTTHKHKVAQKVNITSNHLRSKVQRPIQAVSAPVDNPNTFLRSLFFRRVPRTSFSSNRSGTPRPRSGTSIDATPRLGSIPLAGQSKNRTTVGHGPQRSASFPAPSTDGEDEDHYFDVSSLASSRRPLLSGHTPASTMRSRGSKGRPNAHRLKTDPLPLSSLFTPPGEDLEDLVQPTPSSLSTIRAQQSVAASERTNESGGTASALPKVVVVSGLEHTTAPCQRALMRALTERRIVFDGCEDDDVDSSGRDPDMENGTWNLPDGFLMVYVCKLDPYERPAILNGLVDKFSMSADISLHSTIRQGYLAYRATHTPTPRGTPMTSPLALPHTTGHPYFASQTPVHHSPVRRTTPLPAPTPQAPPALPASELTYLRTLARPHPVAAPIFYPSVHATTQLLFTTSHEQRAPPYAALHPPLDMYLLDLFSATRHYPALDGTLLTMRTHTDAEALARAFRVLNGDTIGAMLVYHEARMGDRETTAESLDDASWADGDSLAWRSAESFARANGNGNGNTTNGLHFDQGSEQPAEHGPHGVRLRVDNEDGYRSFSGGVGEYLDGQQSELSPAEALDVAIKKAWPDVWDVSEEDVARIFPRVVSHRLRVRDGPDDEILGSVMWPAVPANNSADARLAEGVTLGWERKSVKEILVRILADV